GSFPTSCDARTLVHCAKLRGSRRLGIRTSVQVRLVSASTNCSKTSIRRPSSELHGAHFGYGRCNLVPREPQDRSGMLGMLSRECVARRQLEAGKLETRRNRTSNQCISGCVMHVSCKITAGRYGHLPGAIRAKTLLFQRPVGLDD